MSKNKKPKHLLVLKIIGFIGVAVAITGLILTFMGFGYDSDMSMAGAFCITTGVFVGFVCLINGFSPEITKMSAQTQKYIQEENKEDLTEIASTGADISGEAITKVVRSVKKGIKDTKFCKECGAEIDADSKFCNKCGTKQ